MIITNTTHTIEKPNDKVFGVGGTGSIVITTGGSTRTIPVATFRGELDLNESDTIVAPSTAFVFI